MRRMVLATALGAILWGCSGEAPRGAPAGGGGESAFAAIEAEIFAPTCVHPGCHGGDAPAAGLLLTKAAAYDAMVGVPAKRRPERLLVKAGDPEGSYVVERLSAGGDTPRMPIGHAPLSDEQLERVRAWIRDGAKR